MRNASKVLSSWLCLFLFSGVISCASAQSQSQLDKPLVEPQYRLQEDRKAFDDLRNQEPEAKRVENDELAYMENLFGNPLEKPDRIRDRFYKLISKKRELFSKDMTKRREAYVKEERKKRDEFTKSLERERNEFKNRKSTPDERKEFYADIEQKRKDYRENEREKRDEFEEQVRDDRKNFEDYAREKTNDFNARYREFTAKQRDILKEKNAGARSH